MPQSDSSFSSMSAQARQQAIVNEIRHQIFSGQLSPGDRLVQDDLAKHFNVSRTPIREALSELKQEGLIDFSSYKGASVARVSIENLVDIYTVRIALESHASFLSTQNANDKLIEELSGKMEKMGKAFRENDFEQLVKSHNEFHLTIYRAAETPLLYELILRYVSLCNVYQRMSLKIGRGAKDPINEHFDIIHIMQYREADAVAALMRSHLSQTMNELKSALISEFSEGSVDLTETNETEKVID
jgi:DNA-binding GntR family transcriptional regulator